MRGSSAILIAGTRLSWASEVIACNIVASESIGKVDAPQCGDNTPHRMLYVNLAGYICIPLSYLVHFWLMKGHSSEPIVTFILAGLGVVPLAHLMRESTEHLSER